MSILERVNHPLINSLAEERESSQVHYTLSGAQEFNQIIAKDNSVSNNGCFFMIRPSQGSVVDRNLVLELVVNVSCLDATAGAGGSDFGANFAPRQWPISRVMDVCQLQVNNTTITSTP